VIGGALVIAFAMLTVCAVLLYDGRQDALQHARDASRNTLLVIERDILRNVELYDLSLQAVVDGVGQPEVMALPARLRDALLFDRAATAKDLGSMLVLDAAGNVLIDSRSEVPSHVNLADRRYFTVHRDNPAAGLYVSAPLVSRIRKGDPIIVLSRRIDNPDGSFPQAAVGAETRAPRHNGADPYGRAPDHAHALQPAGHRARPDGHRTVLENDDPARGLVCRPGLH
jgi:hypothetical protein